MSNAVGPSTVIPVTDDKDADWKAPFAIIERYENATSKEVTWLPFWKYRSGLRTNLKFWTVPGGGMYVSWLLGSWNPWIAAQSMDCLFSVGFATINLS